MTTAITLGRIQVEFDCLYRDKATFKRLTQKDRIEALLRICTTNDLSFKSFQYLEKKLILDREATK